MIDILYLAKGREEFTRASFAALAENTNWHLVGKLMVFTDGALLPEGMHIQPVNQSTYGGPVAIMNEFLREPGSDVFAKLDNDVIVPPKWLDEAAAVMERAPELDFLGLEPPASRTPAPWCKDARRAEEPEEAYLRVFNTHQGEGGFPQWPTGYALTDSIGGVGLMRRKAFQGRRAMVPHAENGVGGFTNWQQENSVLKGWIVPPLRLFLLDRLPMEPWVSLSERYIASGQQRAWTRYQEADKEALWGWWGA